MVKSKELQKSVWDMNVHYLELLNFLQEVQHHPERIMDKTTPVFTSEKRLYTATGEKTNNRAKTQDIHTTLFRTEDNELLFPRIKAAAEHNYVYKAS